MDQVPADVRREHVDTVAFEAVLHRAPAAQRGYQIGDAAPHDRTSLTVRPARVGRRPDPTENPQIAETRRTT
jgi:hypothetical protein